MNDGEIVRLGIDDLGELLTLQRAAYVTEAQLHDDLRLPPLTQTLDELRAELLSPAVSAWGIRQGARLIAAMRIAVDGASAEVGRLVVAPDRQGRGLGTRLLTAVDSRVSESVERLRLFTGERSVDNLRLYSRLGFREIQRVDAGAYALVVLERARVTS